jgi:hypothetical protein
MNPGSTFYYKNTVLHCYTTIHIFGNLILEIQNKLQHLPYDFSTYITTDFISYFDQSSFTRLNMFFCAYLLDIFIP